MTGLPSPNSLPDEATTRQPLAKAICTAPNSVAQSPSVPKLRLSTLAPLAAAATMPSAALPHVIVGGRPTDTTGAAGNTPTTPTPLNAPVATDATSVPCAPSTGP